MTSLNVDSKIMKFFLARRVCGLIVMMMVTGFMLISTHTLKAAEITSTLILSSTSSLSQTEIVYTYSLSRTIAAADRAINIRSGPSENYERKSGLWQKQPVTVVGTNSLDCEWVYVTVLPTNTFGGWVFSAYLRDGQGKLISEVCLPTIKPEMTPTSTATTNQNRRSDGQNDSFLQRYNMLVAGILALFLIAILYWIAYTKGLFSRSRQTESSAEPSANSKTPKAGVPYLESMLISTQPIYFSLKGKNISIGRNKENTLVIDSRFAQWDTVSSHHARIEQDGDSFIITDLDSKNGVFVDGRRTQENILYDGMRLSLGKVAFVFRVNEK